MTDAELIVRLREDVFYGDERLHNLSRHDPLHMEAADRIEALVKERDRFEAALGRACLVGGTTYLVEKAQKAEARAERLEAAMTQMRDDTTAFRHAVHFRRFITAALKGADHE